MSQLTKLIVNEERGQIVTTQRNTNVDQVVQPSSHDRLVSGRQNGNELALEELVAVEEDVIGEPGTGSSEKTGSKVGKSQLQRLDIVSSNVSLLLGQHELLRRRLHLEVTEVDEP